MHDKEGETTYDEANVVRFKGGLLAVLVDTDVVVALLGATRQIVVLAGGGAACRWRGGRQCVAAVTVRAAVGVRLAQRCVRGPTRITRLHAPQHATRHTVDQCAHVATAR